MRTCLCVAQFRPALFGDFWDDIHHTLLRIFLLFGDFWDHVCCGNNVCVCESCHNVCVCVSYYNCVCLSHIIMCVCVWNTVQVFGFLFISFGTFEISSTFQIKWTCEKKVTFLFWDFWDNVYLFFWDFWDTYLFFFWGLIKECLLFFGGILR